MLGQDPDSCVVKDGPASALLLQLLFVLKQAEKASRRLGVKEIVSNLHMPCRRELNTVY